LFICKGNKHTNKMIDIDRLFHLNCVICLSLDYFFLFASV